MSKFQFAVAIAVTAIALCLSGCDTATSLASLEGFPTVLESEDNPQTEQGIALGERLFHETLLSSDNTLSCASCHQQRFAFGDNRAVSIGVDGALGTLNANPIINLAWGENFFWDGRAQSLEEQALMPIENPLEMNENLDNVVAKLQNDEEYPSLFEQAFGTSTVSAELIGKAIAQFERTLTSSQSKFDSFLAGNASLTRQEEQGRELFFSDRTNCSQCHGTILFTDNQFHDIGLDLDPDAGRGAVTGSSSDNGKFKTPTLRNIEFSGPYMHDGRFQTLRQVLDFYDQRIRNSPNRADELDNLQRRGLNRREKDAIIAFLRTLSDLSFAGR